MNTEKNIKTLIVKKPLKLDCGKTIKDFPIAYETYGSLNSKKDNAILVFHALTGDQFVTGINPVTNKEGWWSYAVGPQAVLLALCSSDRPESSGQVAALKPCKQILQSELKHSASCALSGTANVWQ